MICGQEFCPLEARAKAICSMLKGNAEIEVCEPCKRCSPDRAICWKRLVSFNKDGSVKSIELRRVRTAPIERPTSADASLR